MCAYSTSKAAVEMLTKVMAPPIPVDKLGRVDIVLLSHAQHLDNLDNEGRRLLARVGTTITTPASAAMSLPGKKVQGLATWASTTVTNAAGERLTITATPADGGTALDVMLYPGHSLVVEFGTPAEPPQPPLCTAGRGQELTEHARRFVERVAR